MESDFTSFTSFTRTRTCNFSHGEKMQISAKTPAPLAGNNSHAGATAATTVEQLLQRARAFGFCVNGRLQVAPETVAALLGVKTRQLRRWRLENWGPAWDLSEEHILYKLDDLAEWINQRREHE
jgi:hypothetical protein